MRNPFHFPTKAQFHAFLTSHGLSRPGARAYAMHGTHASTPQEAFIAAYRYRNYWRGNGGLTISGGEPLLQLDFVSEVFRLARAKKVQTALDTSAQPFAPDNAEWMARFDRLLENTDLVILDLKEIDDEKHKKLTGHSNKNILAMAQYVAARGVDLWIRHVLVPGLTDDADGLRQLDAFIRTVPKHSKNIGETTWILISVVNIS